HAALGVRFLAEGGKLFPNRDAAFFRRFDGLPELHQLKLQLVAAPLLRGERHPLRVILLLPRIEVGLERVARRRRRRRVASRRHDLAFELGELALPRKNSVQLAVRREESHALRAYHMPVARYEGFADAQLRSVGERAGEIGAPADTAQPVRE